MCGEVFKVLRKDWVNVAPAMFAGFLAATAITYMAAGTPWGSPAFTFLIWAIIIDATRTYGLIRFSG